MCDRNSSRMSEREENLLGRRMTVLMYMRTKQVKCGLGRII